MKEKPARVDFENNQTDLQVCLMAESGFYASHIAERLHLSQGRVYYRYRKAGVKIRDYRSGRNWMARLVQKTVIAENSTQEEMKRKIRKFIQDMERKK